MHKMGPPTRYIYTMSDKVYSPSSTATWMRCPIIRQLNNEGWVPKQALKKDWAAILGQGFAAGVGIYNNIRMAHEQGGAKLPPRDATSRAEIISACQETAVTVMHERVNEMAAVGMIMDDGNDNSYAEKLDARCRKALKDYIASDPIDDRWTIVDVEKDFGPEYGGARADLIVRDTTGLAVVDYKSKLTLDARYRAKTISEYSNSHQMLHYAWAAGETYDEAVGKYYIGLAILEPRWAFDFIPYPVSPETLEVWRVGSQNVWKHIAAQDAGEEVPWMSAVHQDNFGQCPFYKACFVHHYDERLMGQDYVRVMREKVV